MGLERLLKSHNKHLPLHLERFKGLEEIHDPQHPHRREAHHWHQIITAVDEMMEAVDLTQLAAHLGRRIDPDDKKAVKIGKEWEKTREAVVEGLTKKLTAIAKLKKMGGFPHEEG